MKKHLRKFRIFVVMAALLCVCYISKASDFTSTGGGAWITTTTWGSTVYPGCGISPSNGDYDNVTIAAGHTVRLTHAEVITNLTIEDGAKLILESASELTVLGDLSNEGTLTIETDATSTGSLIIDEDGTIAGEGTVNVRRWIPDELSGNDWHIIASPLNGIDMTTFAANNDVYQPTGYNDYDLAPYNESQGIWNPFILVSGYNSTNFVPGKGMAMRRNLTCDHSYILFSSVTTDLVNSNFHLPVTYTRNGWNAMGNPYTASLDIEKFLEENNANIYDSTAFKYVYLYDPVQQDYRGTWMGYVASCQGFGIKSKSGGGNIYFKTEMTYHLPTQTFKSAETELPTVDLTVVSGNLINITTLRFSEDYTNGIDAKGDIAKFKGNEYISLYTQMIDNDEYDLQDQALPAITSEKMIIPVGLDFSDGGDLQFSVSTELLADGVSVYLEDTKNSSMTLLNTEDAVYTTTAEAETVGIGRFNIIIMKGSITGLNVVSANEYKVFANKKQIIIEGSADASTGFQLYSVEGRCWYSGKAQSINRNTIDASSFPTGVYVLRINHSGLVESSKLVLTEE